LGTFKKIGIGVIIGLIVNGLVLGVPFILNYVGLNFPNLFLVETPIWVTFLILTVLIPVIIMFLRVRRLSKNEPMVVFRGRPDCYVQHIESIFAGVKWKVLYGKDIPFSHRESYAFCESNPLCPDCEFEMEAEKRGHIFKGYYWKCQSCGKFYKCPTQNPYDAHKLVERLVEADIRSGRLKLKD